MRKKTINFLIVFIFLIKVVSKLSWNNLLTLALKRESNKVAHKLARRALCISNFSVWIEDVPPPLLPVVLDDIAGFS